jgi:hypothetical protein
MRCLSALSWPPKSDRYTKMPTSSDGALHNSNTGWCATCINYRRARDGAAAGKSRQRQSAAQLSMNHFVSASIKENNTNAAAK